ncbi:MULTISPECIES: PTS mannitol transporter subunit IICBA [Gordonia]|uniref:PTS mannitol transporter subunit IICBA n=2 Tax=Gordonia TaxID=2053 RepID=UPI0019CA2257|nr:MULTISPECIES: PTS mannitol transporter subunit IICBA [Gordonia]MBD0024052.1 PTS mannitol transporter subunit IICBA [Gordonia sp. (in: high G+C Gram-positive bacteria)]
MSATTTASGSPSPGSAPRPGLRVRVQKLGTALSNMVMPNIGAFIAWGLLTALFIETGWLTGIFGSLDQPDSWVAHIGGWGEYSDGGIVSPMITYLLPLLIGYTGGKMVYDVRGGVVGAIATMGVVAGADVPMFLGAMIMGPLGGWTIKRLDGLWEGKIRPGFEMLVDNFAAGIDGLILAVVGFFGIGPIVENLTDWAGDAVDFLVDHDLLPLTSILIEPAKVLFLNNAINHGVLTPLGTNQALEDGKSILFLLEANPGPGLGLLLAFTVFGKGMAKSSAPGAAIIHFFGGIHEIYFPYVLMKPKLIAATLLGGMAGVFTNVIFNSGLRAPAAPGSIISVYAQTAGDSYLGVTLSVVIATAVSFAVAAFLLKTDSATDDGDLSAATASMESMKGKKSSVASALTGGAAGARGPIKNIVFACDAGMGSSAMGASVLRKKVQQAGFTDVTVVNKAIANLTDTFDLVVTHRDLTERAEQRTPSAIHVSVDNFMGSPRYDEIVETLTETNSAAPASIAVPAPGAAPVSGEPEPVHAAGRHAAAAGDATATRNDILALNSIVLRGTSRTADEAIEEAGRLLVAAGAVEESYVAAMHDRERSVSTFMGNGLAIPHGTNEAKGAINRTAMSFVRYDEPIDWNGKEAEFVVGIAGAGKDHLALLNKIAQVFLNKEDVARLRAARSPEEIRAVLADGDD